MKAIEQYVSLALLAKRDNDKKAHNGEEAYKVVFIWIRHVVFVQGMFMPTNTQFVQKGSVNICDKIRPKFHLKSQYTKEKVHALKAILHFLDSNLL